MSDKLAQLSTLAEQQVQAEAALAEAEALVKQRTRELGDIREKEIPAVMDELELTSFETGSGIVVKMHDSVRANISAKDPVRMGKALQWLRDRGYDKLIKNKVEIIASNDAEAQSVVQYLNKFPDSLDFSEMPSVHPSTLSAWVNKRMLEGAEIDEELLGVYNRRYSKVKVPK